MPYAKVNFTGVHKGKVHVIVSMYLEPGDPYYDKCHLYLVDETSPECLAGYKGELDAQGRPVDRAHYDSWFDALPHAWRDSPFHNHSIYGDAISDDADFKAQIAEALNYFFNFHQYCWANDKEFINEWRKVPRLKGTVRRPFIRGDLSLTQACQAKADDIEARKAEFDTGGDIRPTDLRIGDEGTITIGQAAINRDYYIQDDITVLNTGVVAGSAGTIDTVETYFAATSLSGTVAGTFYLISGTTYKCRDSQDIGNQSTGYNENTGLDIDVEIDDLIGIWFNVSVYGIDMAISGGLGIYYYAGEAKDPGDQASYTYYSGYAVSLYATGEEAGGVTHYGAATLSGVGTLAGIGRGIFIGMATLSGSGILAAVGVITAIGKATLSGVGTLAAIGTVIPPLVGIGASYERRNPFGLNIQGMGEGEAG